MKYVLFGIYLILAASFLFAGCVSPSGVANESSINASSNASLDNTVNSSVEIAVSNAIGTSEPLESVVWDQGIASCADIPADEVSWVTNARLENGLVYDPDGSIHLEFSGDGVVVKGLGKVEPDGLILVSTSISGPEDIDKLLDTSKGNRGVSYVGLGHVGVDQHDGSNDENVSCGYAAGASALERLNKTYGKGKIKGSTRSIMRKLRESYPPGEYGTSAGNLSLAIARLLGETGLGEDIRIEVRGAFGKDRRGSPIGGVLEKNGVTITYDHQKIKLKDILKEALLKKQEVIMLLQNSKMSHFVLFDDVKKVWDNKTGRYRIFVSFMDPWYGRIKEVEYNSSSGTLAVKDEQGNIQNLKITFMICVSPKRVPGKSQVTDLCGDGIIGESEECDPNSSKPNSGCVFGQICQGCKCIDADFFPRCGDGFVSGGEECDPNSTISTCEKDQYCASNCKCAPLTYLQEGESMKQNETEGMAEEGQGTVPKGPGIQIVFPNPGEIVPPGQDLVISWEPVPANEYLVYLDGELVGQTLESQYILPGKLVGTGNHTVLIKARAGPENSSSTVWFLVE